MDLLHDGAWWSYFQTHEQALANMQSRFSGAPFYDVAPVVVAMGHRRNNVAAVAFVESLMKRFVNGNTLPGISADDFIALEVLYTNRELVK